MGNPIHDRFQNEGRFGPLGNLENMVSQYQQFSQGVQGNPRDQVMQLLNSGRMSQDQFNQLSNMATQFQSILGRFGGGRPA